MHIAASILLLYELRYRYALYSVGEQQAATPQSIPKSSTVSSQSNCVTPQTNLSLGQRSNSSGKRTLDSWANDYIAPWNRGNVAFRTAMQQSKRPQKTDLLEFVRKVAEDITERFGDNPGAGNLSLVASRMVQQNSASLADYIGGKDILGDGSSTLRRRLIRHFENENRKKNPLRRKLLQCGSMSTEENETDDEPNGSSRKKRKKTPSALSKDSFGCRNWQPSELPDDETEVTQEEKRVWLLTEYLKSEHDNEKVGRFMTVTYVTQRLFINQMKPPIDLVKEKWPFLLTLDGLMGHFENLMSFNLIEKTDQFLASQAPVIFDLAKSKDDKIVKSVVKKLRHAAKFNGNDVPKTVGCFLLLPALLKENGNQIFTCYDVSKYILISYSIIIIIDYGLMEDNKIYIGRCR